MLRRSVTLPLPPSSWECCGATINWCFEALCDLWMTSDLSVWQARLLLPQLLSGPSRIDAESRRSWDGFGCLAPSWLTAGCNRGVLKTLMSGFVRKREFGVSGSNKFVVYYKFYILTSKKEFLKCFSSALFLLAANRNMFLITFLVPSQVGKRNCFLFHLISGLVALPQSE